MVYDKANELAKELSESPEYREYKITQEKAMENETTKALIREYHQLQFKAQSAVMSGRQDEGTMQQLQKVGEVLQMNPDAAAFLMAEFKLNRMVGDVYKILAEAVDIDLGMLEDGK